MSIEQEFAKYRSTSSETIQFLIMQNAVIQHMLAALVSVNPDGAQVLAEYSRRVVEMEKDMLEGDTHNYMIDVYRRAVASVQTI